MSNNRDLLTEAIADAKAVKETAIANAKAALEEAFTPHLKSMLSAKLEEMDKDDEDIEETITNEEVENVEEVVEVNETEEVEEENKVDEEVNLDELLAELNEDEKVTEDTTEEIEVSTEVTEEEEVEDEIEVEDEESEGEMEDEEIDLEDMSEDDLKGFIEGVIKDMVEAGELEAGEEMESEDEEVDGEIDIEVEDEVEDTMMEEKLDEMDEVSWNDKNNPTRGASKKELDPKKVGQSTSAYSVNLEEALAQVEELKEEIKEVNLLNAKLLYTNKIFKAKNLSEGKKLRVLKAFDKATTVKEAKVVFETLNEGIVDKAIKSINEVKGSASKATGTAPGAKSPIVESDAMVDRFKKLAGII